MSIAENSNFCEIFHNHKIAMDCNSSSSEDEEDRVPLPVEGRHSDTRNLPKFWSVYFMDDLSDGVLMWVNVTSAIREFLRRNPQSFELSEQDFVVWIDVNRFKSLVTPLPEPLNNFLALLRERPLEAINCLALALHQLICENGEIPKGSRIFPRIFNFNENIPLRKLKSNFVGKSHIISQVFYLPDLLLQKNLLW
jgi:hypothetical protein